MRHSKRWLVIPILAFVAMVGAMSTRAQQSPVEQTTDTAVKFTVVQGTTMWDLASKMYGDGNVGYEMFRVNVQAGFLTSADSFRRGDKTIINLAVGQEILLNRRAAEKVPEMVRPTE